ncbi:hypothetical protein HRbin27_01459 [bacterium HR27]|nr:hypothetical protein HRbin27_01459 [bacterium HR27]
MFVLDVSRFTTVIPVFQLLKSRKTIGAYRVVAVVRGTPSLVSSMRHAGLYRSATTATPVEVASTKAAPTHSGGTTLARSIVQVWPALSVWFSV